MDLVVDTNILISFFRENPVRNIILNAKSLGLNLYAPQYAIEELRDNLSDLTKYTKLPYEEIESIFKILEELIEIKSLNYFKEYKKEGIKISPDEKDAPFFALASKLNCAIWSNEPRLKKQSKIKIYNTREILEKYKL